MIERLSRLVDEAALVKIKIDNYMVRFANDEVTVFKHWTTRRESLYLAKDKRAMSLSSSVEFKWEDVEGALKKLGEMPEDPLYLPLNCRPRLMGAESFDNYEKLLDVVKEAVDSADGAERNAGAAVLSYSYVTYEDTAGASGSYGVNKVYLTIRSFYRDLSATSSIAARRVAELNGKRAGSMNSQLLNIAKGLPSKRVEPGRRDLLLSPLIWGSLMGEVVSVWASGTEVLAQSSRYGLEDLGRLVASASLNVEEGAWRSENFGYMPFDSEGCPTRRVEIYREGVLTSFIHTRRSAKYFGTEPTGHAVETYMSAAPSHIEVAPGDAPGDLDGLFKELREGYYIHGNWYTRYQNVKTGQFSTVGRDVALEIKDGRPVSVVKFIRIIDTLENIVKNVESLSKNTLQVYWWDMRAAATAPYVVLRNVGVST